MTRHDPETVRKAAAFVEAVDAVLDKFGVRIEPDEGAIRFGLIGHEGATYQLVHANDADTSTPTATLIGFPQ